MQQIGIWSTHPAVEGLSISGTSLLKPLNDLGPKEWYVIDISKESCQISQNLNNMKEEENKGVFSFCQRRKRRSNLQGPL